jgi:hypothetical protein
VSTYRLVLITTSLISSVGLTHIGGCAAGSDPEDGAPAAASVETPAPELADELRRVLASYAAALQSGDLAAVEGLLSAELRARIAERGPGADFAANLRSFVDLEARKLARGTAAAKRSREPFTAGPARVVADGSVASLELVVGGEPLAKPFYFVDEQGAYKLTIVPPAGELFSSTNTYQVKNNDFVERSFSCQGASATVAPTGQLQAKCKDTCSGFFDGTRFTVNGASVDCDYNSWGIDMYITNNYPVCGDPC